LEVEIVLLRIKDSTYSLMVADEKRVTNEDGYPESFVQEIRANGVPNSRLSLNLIGDMAKEIQSLRAQMTAINEKLAAAMNGSPKEYVLPYSFDQIQKAEDGTIVFVPETAVCWASFGKVNQGRRCVEREDGGVMPFDTYGAEWLAYKY
jgi:hypothetical protein